MQNQKIRVGIVGAGAVARLAHLPGYAADPRAEVVGIVDVNEERAQALAEEFGVPRTYPTLGDLLSDGGVNAVSVCVPNAFHAPIALEALQGGVDVLVEKPMALNPDEAARMVATARDAGRILMVGMSHRFSNRAEVLSRWLQAGRFGKVYHGRVTWMRRRGDPGGWFTDSRFSGGGATMDIGVHALDLAWWLMGRPEPSRVSGAVSREVAPYKTDFVSSWPTAERPADAVFDVEDFMRSFIRFENGATLDLSVAWAVNGPSTQMEMDLYGTKGGARLDPFTIYSEEEGILTDTTPVIPSEGNTWTDEVIHFVDAVESRSEPLIPGEEGLAVVRMLEAIGRSSQEGREVEVVQ